jgi:hypothetical protein
MLAAKALKDLGYATVINLQGGYQKWVQSGMPVIREVPMTPDQIQRTVATFCCLRSVTGQKKSFIQGLLIGEGEWLADGPTCRGGVGSRLMDGDTVGIANPPTADPSHNGRRQEAQSRVGTRSSGAQPGRQRDRCRCASPSTRHGDHPDYDRSSTARTTSDTLPGERRAGGHSTSMGRSSAEGMATVMRPTGPCYRCLPDAARLGLIPPKGAGVWACSRSGFGTIRRRRPSARARHRRAADRRLLTYDALGIFSRGQAAAIPRPLCGLRRRSRTGDPQKRRRRRLRGVARRSLRGRCGGRRSQGRRLRRRPTRRLIVRETSR